MSSLDQRLLMAAQGRTRKTGQVVAALDLGATKVACLVARQTSPSEGEFELLGHGQQSSRGLKGGFVIDMEGLERSVRLAVEDAERMAGQQVTGVRLAVSGPYIRTREVRTEIEMGGREIVQKDVMKLLERGLSKSQDERQQVLHALPVSYAIDGNDGVRDPRGMFADRLGVRMNVVYMPLPVYRNLVTCVSRAHLTVESVVSGAFSSANAVLSDDERDNGAICIDLGGGSTGVTVFMNGTLAYLDAIGVGGQHVTSDLAQGIGTTIPAAERIKTLHGTLKMPSSSTGAEAYEGAAASDDEAPPRPGTIERMEWEMQNAKEKDLIDAPKIGDDGRLQAARMSRSELVGYMQPRVEEIFELISENLSKSGLGGRLPRRAVLTGGGSELPGIRDMASRILSMPVRLAKPIKSEQLGENCQRPTFSASAGLLTFSASGPSSVPQKEAKTGHSTAKPGNIFQRAIQWLKENL